MTAIEIARAIVNVLEEKKGEDIILLDIHEITDFTDYFIFCSGSSDRMLDSLADAVVRKSKELCDRRGRLEGESNGGWLVVDLGDVIIHLFSPDQREYYKLEQLWSKGKVLLKLQ